MTTSTPTASPASPFQMLGDPAAAACVGDVCEIPQATTGHTAEHAARHTEQRVVNQRLDEDRV